VKRNLKTHSDFLFTGRQSWFVQGPPPAEAGNGRPDKRRDHGRLLKAFVPLECFVKVGDYGDAIDFSVRDAKGVQAYHRRIPFRILRQKRLLDTAIEKDRTRCGQGGLNVTPGLGHLHTRPGRLRATAGEQKGQPPSCPIRLSPNTEGTEQDAQKRLYPHLVGQLALDSP
jgi:hypothetical protein